jgi:hypothetical protein
MALPTDGPLSLGNIQTEFGGSNPIALSEYYRGGGLVPNITANNSIPTSGTIKVSDFYGTTAVVASAYTLGYGSTAGTACGFASTGTFYQSVNPFDFSSPLYTNSGLTTLASANFYSDGFGWREWSGTAWLGEAAELCPFGGGGGFG